MSTPDTILDIVTTDWSGTTRLSFSEAGVGGPFYGGILVGISVDGEPDEQMKTIEINDEAVEFLIKALQRRQNKR